MENESKIMSAQISVANPKEDSYKDSYINLLADFQNYKRRTSDQILKAEESGVEQFLIDLFPIIDDLERSFLDNEGAKIIFNQILHLLKKYEIEQFRPKIGEKFNDNEASALYITHNKKVDSGCVSEIIKNGYRRKKDGKIIRYAVVNVEK